MASSFCDYRKFAEEKQKGWSNMVKRGSRKDWFQGNEGSSRVERSRGVNGYQCPESWECFHLRPTTNKYAPVSGFYNWPEVVQLRKHDAAGWALLHFESILSLSFPFHLFPFDAPLLLFPLFFILFAPAYSITTDATDSSLSTSLLRRDISRRWMNNQDIKVESGALR